MPDEAHECAKEIMDMIMKYPLPIAIAALRDCTGIAISFCAETIPDANKIADLFGESMRGRIREHFGDISNLREEMMARMKARQ